MKVLGRPAVDKPAVVAVVGTVLLFIAAACGGSAEKQVTGLVLEAVERNLAEIELIRLRGDDGRVWKFSTKGNIGTTAAHLRQHQLAGETVVVTYREVSGRLIASNVTDAVGPSG